MVIYILTYPRTHTDDTGTTNYTRMIFCPTYFGESLEASIKYVSLTVVQQVEIVLSLQGLFMAFVIIRVKSSQDILQGVNKLDYLLKVSVFQKYKDEYLEEGKFSIYTCEESERYDTEAILGMNRKTD